MSRSFQVEMGGPDIVVATGDGLTISQILDVLKTDRCGGITIDRQVTDLPVQPGPVRHFRVSRWRLPLGSTTTLAEVWASLKENKLEHISYEIALRWFLTSSSQHLYDGHGNQGRISVLPPTPIEVKGRPQHILFTTGGDGPRIYLFDAQLNSPPQGDFLTAWDIMG